MPIKWADKSHRVPKQEFWHTGLLFLFEREYFYKEWAGVENTQDRSAGIYNAGRVRRRINLPESILFHWLFLHWWVATREEPPGAAMIELIRRVGGGEEGHRTTPPRQVAIFNRTGALEILPLSGWNSGLAAINQTLSLFSCWPFSPDSPLCVCVCLWVCVCPMCMAVSPAASLSDRNASPRVGGRGIGGDSVSELSRQLWLRRTLTDRAVSFDLFLTRALTRSPPPSARFVSRQTASTCHCCPPAWLRICRSVCQPASGLRREASFIKRKQAGDEDMRTVNLLEMLQRLRGSSHWTPARNILHQTKPAQHKHIRKGCKWYLMQCREISGAHFFFESYSFLADWKKSHWPMDDIIPITWLISHAALLSTLPTSPLNEMSDNVNICSRSRVHLYHYIWVIIKSRWPLAS